MELKELLARLPEGSLDYAFCFDPLAPVYTISFRTNTQRDPRSDVLYFADSTMLPESVPADTFFNCVLIDGGDAREVPEALAANRNVNIMLVREGHDPFALYNRLQDYFIEDAGVTDAVRRILMALLSNRGLQNLVEEASGALGNPVLVVDPSYRYVAWHGLPLPHEADDSDYARTMAAEIESQTILEKGIDYIRRSSLDEELSHARRPIVRENEAIGRATMIGAVSVHGVCVAHVMMIAQNRPFTPADEEIFERLVPIVGQELQKSELYTSSRDQMGAYFLANLLRDEQPSQAVIARRLETLGYRPRDTFFLVVLRPTTCPLSGNAEASLHAQIQPLLTASLCTPFDGDLVVLLSRREETDLGAADRQLLERVALTNSLRVGVSNAFGNLTDIRRHLAQARAAIEFGSRFTKVLEDTHVYRYCDYHYMEMLELLSEKSNLMNYCHPSILALLEHDERHGSELTETLFAYMQNTANTARTAKLLNLHKNTLLYRMGRIREILGNDLTSGEDLFIYHLSIRTLIYLGLFEPRTRPATSEDLHAEK